ncbi:MAG TPA: hypothetical protein VIT65_13865 [Microlunatus sp.]
MTETSTPAQSVVGKIPTIYLRDFDTHLLTDQVSPGCDWVFAREGVATRKFDGTCTMLDSQGHWWARREVKPDREPPLNFWFVSKDLLTGKRVGWEPIGQSAWAKQHADALEHDESLWEEVVVLEGEFTDVGTYELCGPKVNGNPEQLDHHQLIKHGTTMVAMSALSPIELVRRMAGEGWEGIVWHHPDGRMAKLKARDLRGR